MKVEFRSEEATAPTAVKRVPLPKRLMLALTALAAALLTASCFGGEGAESSLEEENEQGTAGAGASAKNAWPAEEVAAEVGPSVVQVNIEAVRTTSSGEQQEGRGLGSGVIYREDGYIVTRSYLINAGVRI